MENNLDHCLAFVAIDFGTTYSGYSFSFAGDDAVYMNKNWGAEAGLQSFKTPTSVLTSVGNDGSHTFEAFGFEAEKRYTNKTNEISDVYLFDKFKMQLHGDKIGVPEVKDVTETVATAAIDIFSMALKYIKDHFMTARVESGFIINLEDICWTVTVPAIWSEYAKSFTRSAAHKGGLIPDENSNRLKITLEPEAASLYCKNLNINDFQNDTTVASPGRTTLVMSSGTVYMLGDAGGGTFDVTVHQVIDDRHVKELDVASGGPWGGTNVNAAFTEILVKLWGEEFIQHVKIGMPALWWKLQNDFELFKRTKVSHPDSTSKACVLTIPWKIAQDYSRTTGKDIMKSAEEADITGVEINDEGSIVLSSVAVVALFEHTVNKVVACLADLFKAEALRKVDYLFMVGGFSCSLFLTSAIKERFSKKTKIMIPEDPTTAIMKGALMFSKNPSFVKERLARATYGINAIKPFNPAVHDESRSLFFDGNKECGDIFEVFIGKGTSFKLGQTIKRTFTPETTDAENIMVEMFACPRGDVVYVNEDDVTKIGTILVAIDNKPGLYHPMEISFHFGESELKITVKDLYGLGAAKVERRVAFQHR